jgi:secondary thiamine-phosphate synthase enzyme
MDPAARSANQSAAVHTHVLDIKTTRRTELVDITAEVQKRVAASGVGHGICQLYVPHTTAGLTINENDDPEVARDIEAALDRLVPRDARYRHREANADAHIKSTLTGVSQAVAIEDGRLSLGRWQAIFFCEFDGPRQRRVHVKILSDPAE